MAKLVKHLSPRQTVQTQRIPGAQGARQVENNAGGFVFEADLWSRLRRFLVLGSEGGTYYASEQKLTVENAACVNQCADVDAQRTLDMIVDVSHSGSAPKNDYALLALAILYGRGDGVSRKALEALPQVARIGTHLFQFVDAAKELRGCGRAFRTALTKWYTDRDADQAAFQITKYQQRGGWSHRDVLRLARPSVTGDLDGVFAYATGKPWREKLTEGKAYDLLDAVEQAKTADAKTIVRLIQDRGLVREHIPTEHLNSPVVWEALLEKMPLTALIRNLGKMSSIGLLKPLSDHVDFVCTKLADQQHLLRSRVHPIAVLMAQRVYQAGRGIKGSLTWRPDRRIIDTLDAAFYAAFGNVTPSNKKHLLAIDVSGSMSWGDIAGTFLTPRDASAAMAMVAIRTEPKTYSMCFSHQLTELPLSRSMNLSEVISKVSHLPFGGTDCALPMLYATEHQLDVEVFVVYTDNETWAGRVHPVQALQEYRRKCNPNAKLIVNGMTASKFTIADPNDLGMLDVVGFDAATPNIMADFAR